VVIDANEVKQSDTQCHSERKRRNLTWNVIANEMKQSHGLARGCHGLRPGNDICRQNFKLCSFEMEKWKGR